MEHSDLGEWVGLSGKEIEPSGMEMCYYELLSNSSSQFVGCDTFEGCISDILSIR